MISFDKMHGNGNDFIVMNSIEQEFSPNKRLIKKLSDRNLGIGFDQLILVDLPKKPDSGLKLGSVIGTPIHRVSKMVQGYFHRVLWSVSSPPPSHVLSTCIVS